MPKTELPPPFSYTNGQLPSDSKQTEKPNKKDSPRKGPYQKVSELALNLSTLHCENSFVTHEKRCMSPNRIASPTPIRKGVPDEPGKDKMRPETPASPASIVRKDPKKRKQTRSARIPNKTTNLLLHSGSPESIVGSDVKRNRPIKPASAPANIFREPTSPRFISNAGFSLPSLTGNKTYKKIKKILNAFPSLLIRTPPEESSHTSGKTKLPIVTKEMIEEFHRASLPERIQLRLKAVEEYLEKKGAENPYYLNFCTLSANLRISFTSDNCAPSIADFLHAYQDFLDQPPDKKSELHAMHAVIRLAVEGNEPLILHRLRSLAVCEKDPGPFIEKFDEESIYPPGWLSQANPDDIFRTLFGVADFPSTRKGYPFIKIPETQINENKIPQTGFEGTQFDVQTAVFTLIIKTLYLEAKAQFFKGEEVTEDGIKAWALSMVERKMPDPPHLKHFFTLGSINWKLEATQLFRGSEKFPLLHSAHEETGIQFEGKILYDTKPYDRFSCIHRLTCTVYPLFQPFHELFTTLDKENPLATLDIEWTGTVFYHNQKLAGSLKMRNLKCMAGTTLKQRETIYNALLCLSFPEDIVLKHFSKLFPRKETDSKIIETSGRRFRSFGHQTPRNLLRDDVKPLSPR